MDNFIFKELSKEDLAEYAKSAKVFNYKREDIENEEVVLVSFYDEKFGSSKEDLCIAVSLNGSDFELVKKDFYADSDYVRLSDVLRGIEYDKVMVIVRRMSNMILDKVRSSASCYIYSVLHDDFKNCVISINIVGILAKNVVYLSKSLPETIKDVRAREDIDSLDKKEILNWLGQVKGK